MTSICATDASWTKKSRVSDSPRRPLDSPLNVCGFRVSNCSDCIGGEQDAKWIQMYISVAADVKNLYQNVVLETLHDAAECFAVLSPETSPSRISGAPVSRSPSALPEKCHLPTLHLYTTSHAYLPNFFLSALVAFLLFLYLLATNQHFSFISHHQGTHLCFEIFFCRFRLTLSIHAT